MGLLIHTDDPFIPYACPNRTSAVGGQNPIVFKENGARSSLQIPRTHVTSRMRRDAALYMPPPRRKRDQRGGRGNEDAACRRRSSSRVAPNVAGSRPPSMSAASPSSGCYSVGRSSGTMCDRSD